MSSPAIRNVLTDDVVPGDAKVCPIIAEFLRELHRLMPPSEWRKYMTPLAYHVAGSETSDSMTLRARTEILIVVTIETAGMVYDEDVTDYCCRFMRGVEPVVAANEAAYFFNILAKFYGDWPGAAKKARKIVKRMAAVRPEKLR